MFKWHYFDIIKILSYYVTSFEFIEIRGVRGGGRAPRPPLHLPPPESLRGGTHEEGSFHITSACISLPQARQGAVVLLPPLGVPDGALPPLENTKLKGNYV